MSISTDISDLCSEVFLLQNQGKKVAWERTAMGQLDQPPAQAWEGFRITSEPLQVDIYSKNRVHRLLEYTSLGLPTLLAKKLEFALFFKPSHEQVGDIN